MSMRRRATPLSHGGLRHGGGHVHEHARIERLGNDVVAAEHERFQTVGADHLVGYVLLGEGRQRAVPRPSSFPC